jgi:hypothetical protein
MARPDLWLGDVARVMASMPAATRQERDDVVRMLGFEKSRPGRGSVSGTVTPDATPVPTLRHREGGPPPRSTGTPQHGSGAPPPEFLADLPLLGEVARESDVLMHSDVEPLSPAPTESPGALPHEPLLPPRSAAAVVQAALSRMVQGGELDVDAVVRMLAEGKPIVDLPRRRVVTMRLGVDLLVDLGEGMQPFTRDQMELVAQVRRIAGIEATAVRYFDDVPTRGAGEGPAWTWTPYHPAAAGARILVVSDFGIGGPTLRHRRSTLDEWRAFARIAAECDCDVVGLVPYPRRRWSPALRRLFPLLAWDRSTTAPAAFSAAARS